ncbi:ATPase inhibitor IATP mitochondria [Penicillium cf. griseofulvum]|uniref:ATPase inhibitor IATP mitochondria n=1 Tax=Penicillium cf. griseofulvum TaxID=2972120 RepID=A0A9W9J058_9EURO|nr:ATPase inhibitor IATP mitochondria [Penicillium cf. griseofulvum]KAJ5430057.1 ATPase inhibitor IATP mitochondria [Penicillium cf. griseofulvum]KAJ5436169.1 ATPase inhibitor IATP mitochondria [Penicillium cf. griseofulvum]
MTLFVLPNELLLVIAETQDSQNDINAFARTSHRCYILLNSFLYAYNVRKHQGSALHWAATKGQLRTAQESLRQGAEIESNSQTGKSPLIQSTRCGHADIVALLLAHGANPHAKGGWGSQDAITSAVIRNKAAVARILLDNGVDANSTGSRASLLHLAAEKCPTSREAVARVLIEKGAKLESMNSSKQTPLQVACQSGSMEVARCLIESGADLNIRDQDGMSLLHLASSNGVETAKLLVEKGADIEAKDEKGETPLHVACWNGQVETAAFLLDKGAKIEAQSVKGNTPLLRGVLWETTVCKNLNPPSVTALLLERGANSGRGNDYNITPLHCATSKENAGLCKILLQYGADPESKTIKGLTPLHKLAQNGSFDSARHLLQKGADVQPRDREGNTPLHVAAQRNDVEFVGLLLEAGADRLIMNRKGQLPIHLSSEGVEKSGKRQKRVMDLLEAQSEH